MNEIVKMLGNLKQTALALVVVFSVAGGLRALAADEGREADHVALRALRDRVTEAINKQDIKGLGGCFARQFAFTAVNQTVLTNETQVQEFFDRMFSRVTHFLPA